jgi:homoaconitate hydratase
MGARSAKAYLASPAVVAASAIAGKITSPDERETPTVVGTVEVPEKRSEQAEEVKIIDGFPQTVSGELIYCHQDNLNTDGIYPGKYTYIDDFTPAQQAEVVMENYDQEFSGKVKEGDILIGGFNFGTGSSREQAATALKYRGIRLVLAGSFSETYRRNALNNGFLAIEAPQLVRHMKEKFGSAQLTVRTGINLEIDFANATIEADGKTYSISPVGAPAQELIVCGGLENWVKENM